MYGMHFPALELPGHGGEESIRRTGAESTRPLINDKLTLVASYHNLLILSTGHEGISSLDPVIFTEPVFNNATQGPGAILGPCLHQDFGHPRFPLCGRLAGGRWRSVGPVIGYQSPLDNSGLS